MHAGRVKVTVTPQNGEHITLLFKCYADNRQRQYAGDVQKNWVDCPYEDCTHLFVEVPTSSGTWNDKVGTFYPRSGKWFDADDADPRRTRAAILAAMWLEGQPDTLLAGFRFQEASECGVCGLELTDPVSIDRGVGPTCYGKLTGSQHQTKWTQWANGDDPVTQVAAAASALRHTPNGTSAPTPPPTPPVAGDVLHKPANVSRYHAQAPVEDNLEDLGINSAGENALYSLAMGMDLDQLLVLHEWAGLRIQKLQAHKAQASAPQTPTRDQGFLAR